MITRRGLITSLGCLLAAPAIVRAESLMKVRQWVDATNYGDGVTDATYYLQRLINESARLGVPAVVPPGTYRTTVTLSMPSYSAIVAPNIVSDHLGVAIEFVGDGASFKFDRLTLAGTGVHGRT